MFYQPPLFNQSEYVGSSAQEKLFNCFFGGLCPIIVDWDLQGQVVNDDGLIYLGMRAGPLFCPTHLIHEMAHLVEIDDERMRMPGWGRKTPTQYILYPGGGYGDLIDNPQTHQASLRECRVMALQWNVQKFCGIETEPKDIIVSLRFMSDFSMVPYSESESYTQTVNDRLTYLENKLYEYARDRYTLSFFINEWKRKINLLSETITI